MSAMLILFSKILIRISLAFASSHMFVHLSSLVEWKYLSQMLKPKSVSHEIKGCYVTLKFVTD